MPDDDGGLERALARTEADAASALQAAGALTKELKRAHAAAREGAVRDLTRSLDALSRLAEGVTVAVTALRSGWTFDERAHLEGGAYAKELMTRAEQSSLPLIEEGGRLLTYPSVLRVLPADAAIEIDRKREKRIRPSLVIDRLLALQQRAPRFKAEQFLESLYRAYELLLAEGSRELGSTVRLDEVHELLTLLPGQSREYTREEFARDVYLLEASGVERTKQGLGVSLPAATGTKGRGSLSTVSREGIVRVYFGLRFER